MCYVSPEAIAKGIADYEAKIKDEYLRDTEGFKTAVAKLGFAFVEGAKGAQGYSDAQEDYFHGGEYRPVVLELVWSNHRE